MIRGNPKIETTYQDKSEKIYKEKSIHFLLFSKESS